MSFIRKILERRGILLLSLISLFWVVCGWAWAYFRLRMLETPIILHFSTWEGIDRIGTITDIHKIGGIGLAIVLVNSFIALALAPRDRFLARMTALATFVMALLLFILFGAIIGVN
jgi:hypothetical protein